MECWVNPYALFVYENILFSPTATTHDDMILFSQFHAYDWNEDLNELGSTAYLVDTFKDNILRSEIQTLKTFKKYPKPQWQFLR